MRGGGLKDYVKRLEAVQRLFRSACKRYDYEEAIKFINQLVENYEMADLCETEEFAKDMHNYALVYDKCNKLDDAKFYYESSERLKKILNYKPISLSKTLNNLGLVYYRLDEWEKGIKSHKEVYEIRKNELGENNIETIYSLYHIGNGYRNLYNFNKAIFYLDKSLEKIKMIDKVESESLVDIYGSIGICCESIGNYKRCIASCETVLYFLEKQEGNNIDDNLFYIELLSRVYEKSGFIKTSYEYYKKAIDIRKYKYKEPTLGYLFNYIKFGEFCSKNNYNDEAVKIFQNCFNISAKLLDKSHEAYTAILNELSISYAKIDDFQNAKKCANLSLKHRMEFFHNKTELLCENYMCFSEICTIEKNYKESFYWLEKALNLLDANKQNASITSALVFREMSNIYNELDAYNGTIACLNQAIIISKNINSKKLNLELLMQLSDIYLAENKYEETIFILKKLDELYLLIYGKNHPEYAVLLKKMAITYDVCGEVFEAVNYLEKVNVIQMKTLDCDSVFYIETLELLADGYFKLENYQKTLNILNDIIALNFEEDDEDKNHLATMTLNIAICYLILNKQKEAEEYFNDACVKQKQSGVLSEEKYDDLYIKYMEIYAQKTNKDVDNVENIEDININALNNIKRRKNRKLKPNRRLTYKKNIDILEELYKETINIKNEKIADLRRVDLCFAITSLAQKIGDIEYAIETLNRSELKFGNYDYINMNLLMGQMKINIGDYQEAFKYFLEAKKISEKIGDIKNVNYTQTLYFFGEWHTMNNDFSTANTFFSEWHILYKKIGLPLYDMYERKIEKIAKMNFSIKNYNISKKFYIELMKIAENNYKNSFKHLNSVLKVAHINILINSDKEKIIVFLETAKTIIKNMEKKSNISHSAYDKLGRLYLLINEFEMAFDMLKLAYNRSFEDEKSITNEGFNGLIYVLKKLNYSEIYNSVKNKEKI